MPEKLMIHCGGVGFNFYFRGYESHRIKQVEAQEKEGMKFLWGKTG